MTKKGSPIRELIPTRLLEPSERPAVRSAPPRSKRFRYIYVLTQLCRLLLGNSLLSLRGKKTELRRKERIIKCLQRLGMLWIRISQVLSLRGSILSTSFGLQLLDLRDQGGAQPFNGIRKTIEDDLGRPLEEVFDSFDETPFAATTVSQLHRARLRDEQVWTAVKIQQPKAEEIFDRDLKLFRRIIFLLKLFSIREGMRWNELYHELKEIKVRELNYYYEAAALEELAKNLDGQPVHVPRVFRRYCRKRVMVMAFIQGALLSDIRTLKREDPQRLNVWLKENNIQLPKVARRLFRSTYRQVFEDNFFHGDMNTGNIILLRDSNLAVIECRSAGSLEMESLEKQRMFLRSLTEKEYVSAAEIYFLLASRLPRVNLNMVKDELVRVWRVWETRVHIKRLPYEEKSLAYMTGRVNGVVQDSQFAPLWSFTRLTGTWVHLDNSLNLLDPDWNYLTQLKGYFHKAEQRETLSKLRRLPSRLGESLAAIHEWPRRRAEYSLFRETLMRRQAQVVQGSASKLDALISTLFGFGSFLLLLTAGLLLLFFAGFYFDFSLEPVLGKQLSGLAARLPQLGRGAWLAGFGFLGFLYIFFRGQKKRFNSREFGQDGNGGVSDT